MSSSVGTFRRVILLGLRNFWRNRWLTLGATLLMTLTLTMISASLLITFAIKDTTEAVRDKINLSIYFRDDKVVEDRITALKTRIELLANVESVSYVDKVRALEIFKRLPINNNIKDPVGESYNPLPRSLEVKMRDVEQLEDLRDAIVLADTDKLICSECISLAQNKEIIDQVVQNTKDLQTIGWLLSIFFGVIAVFNVSNIIRITIAARSDEIEIMRYVGASNAFSRGPFIVEGLLYGLLGTIITSIALPMLLLLLRSFETGQQVSGAFSLLGTDPFDYLSSKMMVIVITQLLIGSALGVLVSYFSVRRYLKA